MEKTTEISVYRYTADKLAEEAHNPGIDPEDMLKLAEKVIADFKRLIPEDQARRELEYLARHAFGKLPTDRVEKKTQEATHRIINGAHEFRGYEAPERPVQSEQFNPHDWDDPKPAA